MRLLGLIAIFAISASAQRVTAMNDVVAIPRIDGITVDGNPADWATKGFRADVMAAVDRMTLPPADFDPTFRLAWDARGLLALVSVRDDVWTESADESKLAQKDSVELFLASGIGTEDWIRVTIAPGMSADVPELKIKSADQRKRSPKEPIAVEAVRAKTTDGYTMEVLIPWKNLGIAPKAGVEAALQIQVNDVDADAPLFRAAWYPQTPPAAITNAMFRIRLASRASAPVRAVARGQYDDLARAVVRVVAATDLAGKEASIRDSGKELASAKLVEADGRPRAEVKIDLPPVGESFKDLRVRVGRDKGATVVLPDAQVWRAQKLMIYAPKCKPPVFAGNTFPDCDYDNPLLAERLLGKYRVETAYYDAKYNKVDKPDAPGRYGAVVDVIPDKGRPLRRYVTLYHQQKSFYNFAWWYLKPTATVSLPPDLGIEQGSVDAQGKALGTFMQWRFNEALGDDKDSAVVLAGMSETPADSQPRGVYDDAFAMDRQWWVGLKRKLDGMEAAYPNAFVCPQQKEGEPARVLKIGSPDEAGVKPECIDKIDGVLKEWTDASKEPFGVCLARHGVVYFERAYGERFGQPMAVDTKSWMASISKFLSGVSMMTLVDQGLVDLDKPLDAYLPQLRGIEVKTPLTVRHCFTHTNGLGLGVTPPRMFVDHYGDEMNDYEDVVAGYYPYLEVGTRHQYNGCGYALAGKTIEELTGEALPQFFNKHIWAPLGCTHTDEIDMSARTMSTPRDIATLAQMLLNKGAYGNMRFFKEETLEKMMPVKLQPYVSFPAGDLEWGIGAVRMGAKGLSPKTYGHGAASAATLYIDPENDLIVVMCRNSAGPKFGEFHPKFVEAIVNGL